MCPILIEAAAVVGDLMEVHPAVLVFGRLAVQTVNLWFLGVMADQDT